MGVIRALQSSSNNFANPNDRVGHGIPDAKKHLLCSETIMQRANQYFRLQSSRSSFLLKTDPAMNIVVERKLQSETTYSVLTTLRDNSVWQSQF